MTQIRAQFSGVPEESEASGQSSDESEAVAFGPAATWHPGEEDRKARSKGMRFSPEFEAQLEEKQLKPVELGCGVSIRVKPRQSVARCKLEVLAMTKPKNQAAMLQRDPLMKRCTDVAKRLPLVSRRWTDDPSKATVAKTRAGGAGARGSLSDMAALLQSFESERILAENNRSLKSSLTWLEDDEEDDDSSDASASSDENMSPQPSFHGRSQRKTLCKDLFETKRSSSGLIHDYLVRMKTAGPDPSFRRIIDSLLSPKEVSALLTAVELQAVGLSPGIMEDLRALIGQERCLDSMSKDITVFWKCQGDKEWRPSGLPGLIKCARSTVAFKRQAACLREETKNSLMRQKMTSYAKQKENLNNESPLDHWNRLQEFWTYMRIDDRKTDNLLGALAMPNPSRAGGHLSKAPSSFLGGAEPMEAKKAWSPLEDSSAFGSRPNTTGGISRPTLGTGSSGAVGLGPITGSRPTSRSSVLGRPNSRTSLVGNARSISRQFTLSSQVGGTRLPTPATLSKEVLRSVSIDDPEPQLLDMKEWKTRGCRSHCSYGHESDLKSREFPSSPSAPTQAASKMARWENEADEKQHRGMNQVRPSSKKFVGKWWAKGLDLAPFLTPGHIPIPKSASLPSLRHGVSSAGNSKSGLARDTDLLSHSDGWRFDHAPKEESAFKEPWESSNPKLQSITSPPKVYLRACSTNKSSLFPMSFVTGHSTKLDMPSKCLLDNDIISVTDVARGVPLEEVDLSDNPSLTKKSLLPLVEALRGAPIRVLKLCRLVYAGQGVLDSIISLINAPNSSMGAMRLQVLDLSSIPIACNLQVPLCKAIMDHPCIKTVGLAGTGLGGDVHANEIIKSLLGSPTMEALDIGWNSFTAEELRLLGECVMESKIVKSLGLANCVRTLVPGEVSPVLHFVEFLSRDRSLTHLDIAMNRIDYRGALIVEDALMNHSKLADLYIANNPLGMFGTRSILRLLSLSESGLQNFRIEDCHGGAYPQRGERHPVFVATNPSGRYVLDLTCPYSRSLLRMLYKVCDRFAMKPELAFKDITVQNFGGPFAHAVKEADGTWAVNTRGRISLTFTTERAVEGALKDVDENDFVAFLNTHNRIMRYSPAFKKVVPLFVQFKRLEGCAREQQVFIDALCEDFSLTYPQLKNLVACCSNEAKAYTIWSLLPCIEGGAAPLFLSACLTPSFADLVRSTKQSHPFLHFNAQNPTGHYRLDLGVPTDHMVAEWLLLLDRWEVGTALKNNRPDTSQKGNRSQLRNEWFEGHPLEVASMAEWTLPHSDILEFDYCSIKRAPPDAACLDKVTMSNIMIAMQGSDLGDHLMMETFRMVSHLLYMRSIQVREVLGIIKDSDSRLQIFVTCFNRIVDMWNEKVFRVRFKDDSEFMTMCHRVGFCSFFPFIQPEQVQLEYDLQYHDQRLAANQFVVLAFKERPENVLDLRVTHPDGTPDPLPTGLPRSWESFDRMPQGGIFQASYKCAPEDRKFQIRKSMFESYGFWRMPVLEEQVMWWADINKVPEDVFEFLTFVADRFESIKECFVLIDGEGGNGNITLREFEDGLKEMQFVKFKKNKKERITKVFRYLDPSGEGQVSLVEFSVLTLLWNEVTLCIREFMQFLERTIGNDLDEVWSFFDEDGGGSVEPSEFESACENIGYFGPVRVIFHLLDKDGEGTISYDEFTELEEYQAKFEE